MSISKMYCIMCTLEVLDMRTMIVSTSEMSDKRKVGQVMCTRTTHLMGISL